MKKQKNKRTNTIIKGKLPESGILCDGYCHQCKYIREVDGIYFGGEYRCIWKDIPVSPNEWHACCEK